MGATVKNYFFGSQREAGTPPAQVWEMGWGRGSTGDHVVFKFSTAAVCDGKAADAATSANVAAWEATMSAPMSTWFGALSNDAKEGIWLAARDYDALINP